MVIWKRSELAPTFSSPLDRLYEPLQYPLFFPHGCCGWFPGLTSTSPPYQRVTQLEYFCQRLLSEVQSAGKAAERVPHGYVRPDLTCRIFRAKLTHLVDALRRGLLGRKVYLMYVVEFQKQGLPHAHAHIALRATRSTT